MKEEKAILYKAEKLDNLLVFKANYKKFQFSRHAHEDYALGLMHSGTQQFHCQGERCYASPGSMITVNAGDVHDGMSADGEAYHYRIIYIPSEIFKNIGAAMVGPTINHRFRNPVTEDKEIALELNYIFHLLERERQDPLEIQTLFYTMAAKMLERHGVESAGIPEKERTPPTVNRACDYINDMAKKNITLDDIALAAGLSRFHFLRVFNASLGITPHCYLLQRRLHIARESIRKGSTIADAAYEGCFADQSHFSRRFKAAYGITPKQYQKAVC